MHCVTCHGSKLSFKAARCEDGTVRPVLVVRTDRDAVSSDSFCMFLCVFFCSQVHVAVTKKITPKESTKSAGAEHLVDFCYVRQRWREPPLGKTLSVPFVDRQISKAGTLDIAKRRKKIRWLQEIGADESVMKKFVPNDETPIRQYFHSRTNEPMLEGEWDLDSDDEPDETWLHKMSEAVSVLLSFLFWWNETLIYRALDTCSFWMSSRMSPYQRNDS